MSSNPHAIWLNNIVFGIVPYPDVRGPNRYLVLRNGEKTPMTIEEFRWLQTAHPRLAEVLAEFDAVLDGLGVTA